MSLVKTILCVSLIAALCSGNLWQDLDDMAAFASVPQVQGSTTTPYRWYKWYIIQENSTVGPLAAQFELFNGGTLVSPNNMTSSNAPSPYSLTYSSSYEGDANWRSWFAFDAYTNTSPSGGIGWNGYGAGPLNLPQWLAIDLGTPKVVTSYNIWQVGSPTATDSASRAWIFYGSKDFTNWVTLDSVTNQNVWGQHTVLSRSVLPH
jgi:hypothetical protein